MKFNDYDSDRFASVLQTVDCLGLELWCYPYKTRLADNHLFDIKQYPWF
jgi:hypothetical protein